MDEMKLIFILNVIHNDRFKCFADIYLLSMNGMFTTILLFGGIFWTSIAVFIARDASKRHKNVIFWFLFTLIFGVISLMIYVVVITPSVGSRSQNYSPTNGSRKQNDYPDIPKKRDLTHSIEKYNFNDNPIVKVSDGENHAKFVIQDNGVSPHSAVYQRKYGDEWMDAAESYLKNNYEEN